MESEFDYIIVGSGAGGAPLASRLARAGKKVLVIEAGANHTQRGPRDPGNEVSRVPVLHAVASEHPDLSWRFFVDHYERCDGRLPDDIPEDPKWNRPNSATGEDKSCEGIFYPRSAGIGGCTIHNAMITIAGPDSDWDEIASFLDDPSWSGQRMRGYFQRVEHNDYLPVPSHKPRRSWRATWRYVKDSVRYLFGFRPDVAGGDHGFEGWLHTTFADLSIGVYDRQLVKILKAALREAKSAGLDNAWTSFKTLLRGRVWQTLDPNHADTQANSPEGVVLIPIAVHGKRTTIHQNRETPYVMLGRRSSPRELLLETLGICPDKLTIWTDCLVTKVILEGDPPTAVGVELQRGERLYRAHVRPSEEDGPTESVRVRNGGEVILCGGAFNTPQLLMLSGIGDPKVLADLFDPTGDKAAALSRGRHRIPCRVKSLGVGKNLQDRYEISVVSQMRRDFSLQEGATYRLPSDPDVPDRHLRQWREEGTGLYTSNGGVLGIFKRSRPELPQPDLFIFGVPSQFTGYKVGYSRIDNLNRFSWVILKSHTRNREGCVKLRSTDPRDTPYINFKYFGTGLPPHPDGRPRDHSSIDPDVKALMHGVDFVRRILRRAGSIVSKEIHPGSAVDNDSAINEWIRRDAWGHHACGTCRMGPEGDQYAVLDSRFRVRGVEKLRVVDASIFPTIPGYFIVTNIYMASEKAADAILEDASRGTLVDPPGYPKELRDIEVDAIAVRRALTPARDFPGATLAEPTPSDPPPRALQESSTRKLGSPETDTGGWSDDVTGLALSGGGIRSATQCLGLLQSLARRQLLRRVDFLSTASGGGYIGSFLGRAYDRCRANVAPGGESFSSTPPAVAIENLLTDPDSRAIAWLRHHGNYVAPNGRGDARLNAAVYLRNLLTVHAVVGVALFSLFCIANLIRFGVFDKLLGPAAYVDLGDMPIGHLVKSVFGPWFSPWFILVEILLLFLVLPRMVGYWVVSEDRHESFKNIPLLLLFLIAGVLLYAGVAYGIAPEMLILGVALLSTLVHVELAWRRGRIREEAVGSGGIATQRLRTRNYLTYDLGLALALTGGAFAFALIDTLARGLQEWKLEANFTYAKAFAGLGAAIMVTVPAVRWLAGFLRDEGATGPPMTVKRLLRKGVMAGLLGVVLFTLPLVAYAFASHALFAGGQRLGIAAIVTALACLVTILLAFPQAVTFVNRSSLAQTYAARLGRAYLGASNPERHRPSGFNVTEVMPGDDVASICNYRPHEASGPFHLINVTINQTVDIGSLLRMRDRQGHNMAVSCLAISVGTAWHSRWRMPSDAGPDRRSRVPGTLEPVGDKPGSFHPLVDRLGRPADHAEMLSLRQWTGISGAAIDPGRGRTTSLGIALLLGLLNVRTGYWWDSGIAAADRWGWPSLSPIRRILYLLPRYFATQSLLLAEWVARYPGPWNRFWHLADGGFFENLAVYELVRRRVPRIIVYDGTADPKYDLGDFAELVRKVRIDFGARIESLTAAELDDLAATGVVTAKTRERLGTIDELRPPMDATGRVIGSSPKHAALCWIYYPNEPESRRSLLLMLKATFTGDEPADVENYHRTFPEFPHEATEDQVFNEAQWESYRKLGEHASEGVFEDDWFWKVPLPPSGRGAA